jgi:hypothetical protein
MIKEKFYSTNIIIANVGLRIKIDKSFRNIKKLFFKFGHNEDIDQRCPEIIIQKSLKRSLKVLKGNNRLIISGTDINNLTDPFNLIGILQAVFRFVGIHSSKKGIYLLHGSTSVLDNKSICFADDGGSTAKTLSSLECALKSNLYLGDEFCFLDIKTKRIFSYPFIPIHFRPEVKNHFINTHKLKLPTSSYQEEEAGYFIEANKLFKIIKTKQLDKFVFVYFHNQKTKLELLNPRQSKKAIAVTVTSPLLKLFYPQLDRMRFLEKQDLTKVKSCNKIDIESLIKDLGLSNVIVQMVKDIPCYRIWIRRPCEIIKMIRTIK